jgi:hypothetical protein
MGAMFDWCLSQLTKVPDIFVTRKEKGLIGSQWATTAA